LTPAACGMSFQSEIAAGFADAQSVFGGITASWGSRLAIPIIPGDVATMLTLIEGGFLEQFSFGFTALETDLPTDAGVGQKLTVAGRQYRVIKITPGLTSPEVLVYCGEVNQ